MGSLAPQLAEGQQYEVRVIDPGPGSGIFWEGITPTGQVVGYFTRYQNQFVERAFVWDNGNFTLLPGGVTSSHARDGNSHGAIVGNTIDDVTLHGAVWQDGVLTDFGALSGNTTASPGNINELGWITGTIAFGNPYPTHPFLYRNGQLIDLGPGPSNVAIPYGINFSGMVVGEFTDQEQLFHRAFVWTEQTGLVLIPQARQAFDVNDTGLVVGRGVNSGFQQGFTWQNGSLNWLALTLASGINSGADIVGYRRNGSDLDAYLLRNGLYIKFDDVVVNLMGLHTYGALDITDSGLVLARMETSDHQNYPWAVLTPVPEPSTFWQLAIIASTILTARYRRY